MTPDRLRVRVSGTDAAIVARAGADVSLAYDGDWAAGEVMRIAREAPARLTDEIDRLPGALRASGAPTRLLDAVAQRSETILAGSIRFSV